MRTRYDDSSAYDAGEYLEKHRIRDVMESIVTGIAYHRPKDPLVFMETCIKDIKQNDLLKEVQAQPLLKWDSFLPLTTKKETYQPRYNGGAPAVYKYQRTISQGVPSIGKYANPLPAIGTVAEPEHAPVNHNNIIFVLGGPGSGKGTQCERLAKEFHLLHISTGDLLRDEVAKGTEIGLEAESLMREGKMVPSEFLFALLKERIQKEIDRPGILLDGFPRTIEQALEFEQTIGPCRAVLAFTAPFYVLQERLVNMSKSSGRLDDNTESIKKRLELYSRQSEAVIEHYKKLGVCKMVAADKPIDVVYKECSELFAPSYPVDHPNMFLLLKHSSTTDNTIAKADLLKKLRTKEKLSFAMISISEMLKREVSKNTMFGKLITHFEENEDKVPPTVIMTLLKAEILKEMSSMGIVMADFPNSISAALEFERTIGNPRGVIAHSVNRSEINYYYRQKQLLFELTSKSINDSYAEMKRKLSFEAIKLPFDGMVIVFVLGGPGSGKGTQCEMIAKDMQYAHISTGDCLRAEVEQGTAIGKAAKELMKEGKMIPLPMILEILKNVLSKLYSTAKGVLIDGFPRTLEQARIFEKTLGKAEFILYFDARQATLTKRLIKRGQTSGREDDNLQSIEKRLKVFTEESYPVIQYFEQLKRVKTIDAEKDIEAVKNDVLSAFAQLKRATAKAQEETPLNHNNIIFVLGGPGSGKGTQCEKLSKNFKLLHVSTGDLLRDEVARKTEIGIEAENLMKEGKMVPSKFLLTLLRNKIAAEFYKEAILIDGFPRTLEQAMEFEELIGPCRGVLAYSVPLDVLQARLLERGKTSGRVDDNLESIKKRLDVFTRESEPVIQHYKKLGLCTEIFADRDVMEVYKDSCNFFAPVFTLDHPNIALFLDIYTELEPENEDSLLTEAFKKKIAVEGNFKTISLLDIINREASQTTSLGYMIGKYLADKITIPPNIVIPLLKIEILKHQTSKSIIISGFPSSISLALEFERTIESRAVDENMGALKRRFGFSAPKLPFDGTDIVFVLGGPGSGKGTQCETLAKDLGYAHVSTGDCLRAEVEQGTEVGKAAKDLMAEGKMIPLDMILEVLKSALLKLQSKFKGFLIDGFPRTMEQAKKFEASLGRASFVLFYDARAEVLTERLLKRGQTSGRADDNLESIEKRLKVYSNESYPVIKYFEQQNRVKRINAEEELEMVRKHTMDAFIQNFV